MDDRDTGAVILVHHRAEALQPLRRRQRGLRVQGGHVAQIPQRHGQRQQVAERQGEFRPRRQPGVVLGKELPAAVALQHQHQGRPPPGLAEGYPGAPQQPLHGGTAELHGHAGQIAHLRGLLVGDGEAGDEVRGLQIDGARQLLLFAHQRQPAQHLFQRPSLARTERGLLGGQRRFVGGIDDHIAHHIGLSRLLRPRRGRRRGQPGEEQEAGKNEEPEARKLHCKPDRMEYCRPHYRRSDAWILIP